MSRSRRKPYFREENKKPRIGVRPDILTISLAENVIFRGDLIYSQNVRMSGLTLNTRYLTYSIASFVVSCDEVCQECAQKEKRHLRHTS